MTTSVLLLALLGLVSLGLVCLATFGGFILWLFWPLLRRASGSRHSG